MSNNVIIEKERRASGKIISPEYVSYWGHAVAQPFCLMKKLISTKVIWKMNLIYLVRLIAK